MKTLRFFALTAAIGAACAQQHPASGDCPMMQTSMTQMEQRGDQAMGFSHEKTTHHFLVLNSGGAIVVEANDPSDGASRDQIRQHLNHIAKMFSAGNFDAPMFIHDQTPPGVPAMRKLKKKIHYAFESTDKGGRVVITTKNGKALSAIHEFLKFQIEEHHTGDPS
jgi:hypothetical protein